MINWLFNKQRRKQYHIYNSNMLTNLKINQQQNQSKNYGTAKNTCYTVHV